MWLCDKAFLYLIYQKCMECHLKYDYYALKHDYINWADIPYYFIPVRPMFPWEIRVSHFVDPSHRTEPWKESDNNCRTNARSLGRRVHQLRAAVLPHPHHGRRQHQVQHPCLRLPLHRVKSKNEENAWLETGNEKNLKKFGGPQRTKYWVI